MLSAAKTAEAVLTTGQLPSEHVEQLNGLSLDDSEEIRDVLEDEEGAEPHGRTSPTLTATTSNLDLNSLTPQTFLIRPTRPDANRNRGKKAFRRNPPAPKPATGVVAESDTSLPVRQDGGAVVDPAATAVQVVAPAQHAYVGSTETQDEGNQDGESASEDEFDETVVEDMEHLQLGLEEAWFLSTALGVLKIYDAASVSAPSLFPRLIHVYGSYTVRLLPRGTTS